jgi:hypothetical protein
MLGIVGILVLNVLKVSANSIFLIQCLPMDLDQSTNQYLYWFMGANLGTSLFVGAMLSTPPLLWA